MLEYCLKVQLMAKNRTKIDRKTAKIGYPIFANLPTYLYPIISDFCKPTYLPNRRISYVDGPFEDVSTLPYNLLCLQLLTFYERLGRDGEQYPCLGNLSVFFC